MTHSIRSDQLRQDSQLSTSLVDQHCFRLPIWPLLRNIYIAQQPHHSTLDDGPRARSLSTQRNRVSTLGLVLSGPGLSPDLISESSPLTFSPNLCHPPTCHSRQFTGFLRVVD
ncbi:unnamed protein product, partial [Brenthis ino]